ncbi:hypothetical protein [Streptomyces sp. NPDC001741]|uniref:hypothetical protein n=1 Tax=Streptomyces sp. NPDC001741 TaxID=3364605 RepID=UPI00367D4B51
MHAAQRALEGFSLMVPSADRTTQAGGTLAVVGLPGMGTAVDYMVMFPAGQAPASYIG